MKENRQQSTPILEAVQQYIASRTVPFHVPGHKQGRGIRELAELIGPQALAMDLTCMPDLDNICNPLGAIKEAEALAAEAYGADHAFFLVNGTTSGIQAMIMAVCQPGDKIIIPRNAHKSALGGLILSGAEPVYVKPEVHGDFGISMGITGETLERALREHPDAKGVFLVYPNYYGTCSDLEGLVKCAHDYGMPVLVDEAHGAHLAFHPRLPLSAVEAGADLVASSTHKLGGSLTQSSILLHQGDLVRPQRVKAVLNLSQTTSPSYLLLCSLDLARKQLATQGEQLMEKTLALAAVVRQEISSMEGLTLLDQSAVGLPGCHELDLTKITVNVQGWGLSGLAMEQLMRSKYGIQVELSDLYNIILIISLGDNGDTVTRLLAALKDIGANRFVKNVIRYCPPLPPDPQMVISPRAAFYSETREVLLPEAEGEICAESIMAYPPGIPLVCPGERLTKEVISYVQLLKQEKADLQGTEDPRIERIKVLRPALAVVGQQPDLSEAAG